MCKNIIGQFLHAVYHTNRTSCLQLTFRRKSHGISQTRNVKYSRSFHIVFPVSNHKDLIHLFFWQIQSVKQFLYHLVFYTAALVQTSSTDIIKASINAKCLQRRQYMNLRLGRCRTQDPGRLHEAHPASLSLPETTYSDEYHTCQNTPCNK